MEQLIIDYAKQLKLPYTSKNIAHHLEQARVENKSYDDFLLGLLEYEIELRHQNGIRNRIKAAKFPHLKYLEELDVKALPSQAKEKLQELSSLDFIANKQNIILAGNPGTGKTHIGLGLGIKACQQGKRVYFAHVPSLIIELKEAKSARMLQTLKNKFQKYELVILDELGYISFDKEGAELLFNFISVRCEVAATIFTTNLPFARWNEIFQDPVITAAIVDRITHRSYVINMNGASYRVQQSKELLEKEE